MQFNGSIICIVFMTCAIVTHSASKYNGVSWNEKRNLWEAGFDINGKKQKAYFDNEFDAAKHLNKLCEKMGMPLQNPEIYKTPNQQKNKKTSQYKGVNWYKKFGKWYAQVPIKGQQQKPGGYFYDELDAAKRVNQLCEELGVSPLNPTISAIPNEQYQVKYKASQYKGVCYDKKNGKWSAAIRVKGKLKYGGLFYDEHDAGKRVNQLCKEFGMCPQNPTTSAIPNQEYEKKGKTSLYKGVSWHQKDKKWRAQLCVKGQISIGGNFRYELDAAKRVNQLCEELKIPAKNPGLSAMPYQYQQKSQKTSHYKGVYWNRERRKWFVMILLREGVKKYGGYHGNELDAAKRVNQICEKLEIPLRNPGITGTSNEQSSRYDDYNCQTNENTEISSTILQSDKDDDTTNKTKRKRKDEELNDADNQFPASKNHYFYEHLLK